MINTPLLPEFNTSPAVFAVGNTYQIMVPVKSPLLFFVEVNGKKYYDHSNGIIRSAVSTHRVTVPMAELDNAGEYTVGYRKIIERKPYFSEVEEIVSQTYKFRPVPKDGKINLIHLSDTHGNSTITVEASSYYGDDLDLLVLNGDTLDHSGTVDNFMVVYKLCEGLTHGQRTCVFSRGNHDTRGVCAELIEDHTPTRNGISYYTFRVGSIWALLVDCAEDKIDEHEAYGHTNCCHEFRLEETEYIKQIIADPENEYNADGVKYRLIISHVPFTHIHREPFDIEQELYGEWTKIIGEGIRPSLMLCGHLHTYEVSHKGGRLDNGAGQFCSVVVGAKPMYKEGRFVTCAVTLEDGTADVKFIDNVSGVIGGEVIELA